MRARTVLTVLAAVGALLVSGTAAATNRDGGYDGRDGRDWDGSHDWSGSYDWRDGHDWGDGQQDRYDRDRTYYVSLGDSLAAGYQPDTGGNTDQSYTDKLYERLKKHDRRLVHIKLGCSGERSDTLIDGGICSYEDERGRTVSQLTKAVEVLKRHGKQVRYVTLDIGANDIGKCAAGGTIDGPCVSKGLKAVHRNLPKITKSLKRAAHGRTQLAGMNYYNPYLAAWLTGEQGRETARQSAQWQLAFNGIISSDLRRGHFKLADVSRAFSADLFEPEVPLPGFPSKVPLNVAKTCELTWMCTQYTDIHANPAGHELIAETFAAKLR